jgi:hypothetical protein
LLLRAAASRSDHILACGEDASSQNVSVKSALAAMIALPERALGRRLKSSGQAKRVQKIQARRGFIAGGASPRVYAKSLKDREELQYSTKAPQVANGQSLQPTNFTRCAAAVP